MILEVHTMKNEKILPFANETKKLKNGIYYIMLFN